MTIKRISVAFVLIVIFATTAISQSNPAPLQIGTRGFAPVSQYRVEVINT